jgi:hypothetical protein
MNSPKPIVTVEDLLRFKRSEQPPPEFWNDFDRELRAKQLAAIVEPRRWWTPLIRVGSRLTHLQVPVGAAAILALTLITIPQDDQTSVAPRSSALAVAQPSLEDQSDLLEDAIGASHAEYLIEMEPVTAETLMSTDQESVAATVPSAVDESPVIAAPASSSEPSPSARYIAANLAAAQEADPGLMDEVFGVATRHAQIRQPIRDPLAHVSAPGETRRSRLLATALPVSASSSEVVAGPSVRLGRKLTEERLYDTISRVGVRGDRVAIKF